MIDPHLLFPIAFVLVLLFWWAYHKLIDHILEKIEERKYADHHRR